MAFDCTGCGHHFNPREGRWGAFKRPFCYGCAKAKNSRAAVLRALRMSGPPVGDTIGFEPHREPPAPQPVRTPDGYDDLGVLARRRGIKA